MTKREAIKECKELWKEIKKSGETKYGFLNSPGGKKWLAKDYHGNCPLCEYKGPTVQLGCARCPLKTQYDKNCIMLGFSDLGRSSPAFFKAVEGLKV